jgi:SOS-response transcriptional repressor LexA
MTTNYTSDAPPTTRQCEILTMIVNYYEANGHGPTIREIGDMAGIASPQGVISHLVPLRAKGLIEDYSRAASRSVMPTGLRDVLRVAVAEWRKAGGISRAA